MLCRERNPKDANYRALEENRERLQDARLADGAKPEVVDLPMPAPLVFDGRRLPASYANFYIANAAVLVPTFNDPNDRVALGILAELFRDRPVVGIHAVELVWGLGTLHCLTQQQPAGGRGCSNPPIAGPGRRWRLSVRQGRIVKYSAPPHARLSPSSRGSTRQTPYIEVSAIDDPATASVASLRAREPPRDVWPAVAPSTTTRRRREQHLVAPPARVVDVEEQLGRLVVVVAPPTRDLARGSRPTGTVLAETRRAVAQPAARVDDRNVHRAGDARVRSRESVGERVRARRGARAKSSLDIDEPPPLERHAHGVDHAVVRSDVHHA